MTVLTIGTFDPFHAGHADLINWCKSVGDYVIVGVLSDAFVALAKGREPLLDQDERVDMIQPLCDLAYVEHGRVSKVDNTLSHPDAVIDGEVDLVVVGSDWHERDYLRRLGLTQKELDKLGVGVLYVPRRIQQSATELKRRARG